MLLDLEIRHATNNTRSLDDWMNLMYSRYALPKPGFEPEDAVRAASEIAGKDMSPFFQRYVTGKEPMSYDQDFAYAGIKVKRSYSKIPWIGMELGSAPGTTSSMITNVVPGSPADESGQDRGDALFALNDKAVNKMNLDEYLPTSPAEKAVTIEVLRHGSLRRVAFTPVPNPYPEYSFEEAGHPTDLERSIYRGIMNTQ